MPVHTAPEGEKIAHPRHYNESSSGVECIEIIRWMNFNVGNVVKYCWRAGLKLDNDTMPLKARIQDLEKARWYLDDELGRLKQMLLGEEQREELRRIYASRDQDPGDDCGY